MDSPIPQLPQEIWRYIIQAIENSDEEMIDQIIHFQSLAEVSTQFYQLIAQKLAEECRQQGPEFIIKLLEVDENKIGVVRILHRLKETTFGRELPLLIVDYYHRHFRCPLCAKEQTIEGEVNDVTPRKFTCPECNTKYGTVIEWQDNGDNDQTERCGCKRLTTRYNYGCCEGCSASCCLDCCGRSRMHLMLCRKCCEE